MSFVPMNHRTLALLTVLLGLAPFVLPANARAENRTVCFRLQFLDDRNQCATSADRGRRRACNPGGVSDARGHLVELWDWDDSGKDDYIGTWQIKDEGRQCIVFPWEGQPYASGSEKQPDPYLRYPYSVGNTQAGTRHYATFKRADRSSFGSIWMRDNYYLNCRPGVTCELGNLLVSPVRGSLTSQFVEMLDSAQHTLHIVGKLLTADIDILYDLSVGFDGLATDSTTIKIKDKFRSGGLVTHELGHIVMSQQWGGAGKAPDYNFLNQPGHGTNTVEYQYASFVEGWAEYIRYVSWWNPANVNSRPRIEADASLGVPMNMDVEDASCLFPPAVNNAGNEFMISKALWDLDDANSEPGVYPYPADTLDLSTEEIILGLRQFPAGTDDHAISENSPNGPNLLDYFFNIMPLYPSSLWADLTGTLFTHNCMLLAFE